MMWIFFSHHLVVHMVKFNKKATSFSTNDVKNASKRYAFAVVISMVGIVLWVMWGSYYTFLKTITGKYGGYKWMDTVLFPKDDVNGYEKMSGGGQAGGGGFFDTLGEVAGNSLRKQQSTMDTAVGATIGSSPAAMWQGVKDNLWAVFEFFRGIVKSFIDAIANVPGNTIPLINKTVLGHIHDLSNEVFKGKERDTPASAPEGFVYTLFGPIIMIFVAVWGIIRMFFQGTLGLFSPEIWKNVMKKGNGDPRGIISTIFMGLSTLVTMPIGVALVGWNAASYALKYLFGGLFLSIPKEEYDGFRSAVFSLFKTAWPITAALIWISITCISPALISEFSTTFTSTFAALGIAALIYAIKGGSWIPEK